MLLTTSAMRWPTLVKATARGRGAMARAGAVHGAEGGGTNPGASGAGLEQTSSLVWGLGTKPPTLKVVDAAGKRPSATSMAVALGSRPAGRRWGDAGGEQAVDAGEGQNGCGRVGRDCAHDCEEGHTGEVRHCPSSHAEEVHHGTGGRSSEQRPGEPTERRDWAAEGGVGSAAAR